MSYIVPFQNIGLFETTFKHQINKNTGKIEDREFVFNKHFGRGVDDLPVETDRYRIIWMPGCPHSNKAVITARLLGLDNYISIGECGVLRDPRGWVVSAAYGFDLKDREVKAEAADDAKETGWFEIIRDDELYFRKGDVILNKDDLAFDHYQIITDALKVMGL